MKGFLSWFKGSTKIKRWMFLILLGIILVSYGFSKMLVGESLEVKDVIMVVGAFVVGFTFAILGLIYIQKRTLELVIEANDTDIANRQKAQVNIQSLIFNKKVYEKGPKVVVIGGGNGLNTIIQGLKNYTSNITAIVTVSDYGNVPTDSRMQLNLLPMDDIKDSIASLAYSTNEMDNLLKHKFKSEKLRDLCFGDIYLSAMEEIYGDMTESIKNSNRILNITGKVLPVTQDKIDICAELEDGTVIKEKNKIPEITYSKVSKINRIYISPSNCKPAPGVLDAIEEADAIIIGPGSLYTNVIPNLLVKNVAKTIKDSKAFKIYVSNIMTQPGQTDNYSISDHIDAIIDHTGPGIVDYCICDTGEIVPEFVRMYNKKGSDIVERDLQKVKNKNVNVIYKDLSTIDGEYIRHDADAIASTIMELICSDLKFKDQQYDTQYILLNSKLKDQKQKEKSRNKKVKKVIKENKPKEKHLKEQSKFNEKYKDRIKGIQESDNSRQRNKRRFEETGSLYEKKSK